MWRKVLFCAMLLAVALTTSPALARTSAQRSASAYWLFFGNAASPFELQLAFWPWEEESPFGAAWSFWDMPSSFSAEWSPWDAQWFWPEWRLWCLAVGAPLLVPPYWPGQYGYGYWWGYPYWRFVPPVAGPSHISPPPIVRPAPHHHKPPRISKQRGGAWQGHSPGNGLPSRSGGFSPPLSSRGPVFSQPSPPPPARSGGSPYRR